MGSLPTFFVEKFQDVSNVLRSGVQFFEPFLVMWCLQLITLEAIEFVTNRFFDDFGEMGLNY